MLENCTSGSVRVESREGLHYSTWKKDREEESALSVFLSGRRIRIREALVKQERNHYSKNDEENCDTAWILITIRLPVFSVFAASLESGRR